MSGKTKLQREHEDQRQFRLGLMAKYMSDDVKTQPNMEETDGSTSGCHEKPKLAALKLMPFQINSNKSSFSDSGFAVDFPTNMRIGYFPNTIVNLASQVRNYCSSNFQFIVAPMINPSIPGFDPICDLHLSSHDWASLVVGYIYCEEFLQDRNAMARIEEQLNYCIHLGLRIVLLECPLFIDLIPQLAHLINKKFSGPESYSTPKILLHIQVQSSFEKTIQWRNEACEDESVVRFKYDRRLRKDPWEYFNLFRSLCQPTKDIGVVLELNGDLPDFESRERWLGEPVHMVILPTNYFIANKKNYPVLSRPYQSLVTQLIHANSRQIHLAVKGQHKNNTLSYYSAFLNHLKNETTKEEQEIETYAKGYEDFLQLPLQPLKDNLETGTYEIFEKDPVKYEEYERAITYALNNLPAELDPVVILLVGAGRGPLIRAALNAATITNIPIHLYAVEKNPHAVVTLRSQEWAELAPRSRSTVDVIASDIRDWQAPKLADIVISELLGSWADNELSPECLDGVWRCVKPEAISIPQSYRSYVAPIMSQKLYSETANLKERDKPWYYPFECTYVSYLRNFYEIDEPKKLFDFFHDNLSKPPNERNNNRSTTLTFRAKIDCVCHGFAGYFDTTLYNKVCLSTVPKTHTSKMISWFPLWIPLIKPIQIKQNDTIEVEFWRVVNRKSVWYEWCVTKPVPSPIQNSNGRSLSIDLL